MRFQLWALVGIETNGIPGVEFRKLAEGGGLAALLSAFRDVLTDGSASRIYLIDTTANTVTKL